MMYHGETASPGVGRAVYPTILEVSFICLLVLLSIGKIGRHVRFLPQTKKKLKKIASSAHEQPHFMGGQGTPQRPPAPRLRPSAAWASTTSSLAARSDFPTEGTTHLVLPAKPGWPHPVPSP